jgi:DNA-binding MarR family transcriptional regulator
MPDARPTPADLDFASFVELALRRAGQLSPGVDTDAAALVLTLHRAASAVVYDLESTVHRPRGFTWAGFRLMFALWIAGPLDAKDAAKLSGLSRQAASLLANTLERDGLLTRAASTTDRRGVTFALSDEGTRTIASSYEAHNERERLWADLLTTEEREVLVRTLGKLLSLAPTVDVRQRH